jgi:hypothetical protein
MMFPKVPYMRQNKEPPSAFSSLSTLSKPVLPVDDISIIIYHPENGHFQTVLMVFFPS